MLKHCEDYMIAVSFINVGVSSLITAVKPKRVAAN
jgi:hypothetical protein